MNRREALDVIDQVRDEVRTEFVEPWTQRQQEADDTLAALSRDIWDGYPLAEVKAWADPKHDLLPEGMIGYDRAERIRDALRRVDDGDGR